MSVQRRPGSVEQQLQPIDGQALADHQGSKDQTPAALAAQEKPQCGAQTRAERDVGAPDMGQANGRKREPGDMLSKFLKRADGADVGRKTPSTDDPGDQES